MFGNAFNAIGEVYLIALISLLIIGFFFLYKTIKLGIDIKKGMLKEDEVEDKRIFFALISSILLIISISQLIKFF